MKFGLALGQLNPARWEAVTVAADRLGFESVWMPEHLVLPAQIGGSPFHGSDHPPIPPDVAVFDPFVYLAFLAAKTTHVRFGTHVYNIGLRHPFSTARAVTTLDVLSGGRLEFGVGASWLEAEWRAVGLDFASRGSRVDEALSVCRRLWTEPTVAHKGRWFAFEEVAFEPKPVQKPYPPIHIGGDGVAALRRAGAVGDGWIPMNHTVEALPAALGTIAEHRRASDRGGRTEVTMGLMPAGPDDVERWSGIGIDRLIVRPWRRSSEALEGIERFAQQFLQPR